MTFKDRSCFRRAKGADVVLAAIGAIAAAGALGASAAIAQDNRDQGKSAQQIFATDCALCHKSPQGLAKGGGLFGVEGFLRDHYTASRETAAVMAKYIQSFGDAPAETPRRPRKPATASKPAPKPDDAKPTDAAASDSKPAEAKPKPKTKPKPESKPEPKSE